MSCQRFTLREPGHVGVGELVDQRHLWVPGQHGVDVHLLEGRSPVGQRAARHEFKTLDHLRRVLATVGLHEPDDHVRSALGSAVTLAKHGVGLAHPGRCAEVDPELPTVGHVPSLPAWCPCRGPG